MDFDITDEQRLIVDTIRRFIQDEIVPLEQTLDPDAYELPRPEHQRLMQKVRDMGFYGLDVPAEYGGPGLDLLTLCLAYEEMAQHRAGLYAPAYGVFGVGGLVQLYVADDHQKEKYLYPMLRGEKKGFFGLTEPSGGSDPARAIQTRAVRDGDCWLINGAKIFTSGAADADFGLVYARTDPEKGRRGITCFIVDTDTPGFSVRRIVHTLRSADPATEISLDNVRVPHQNVLGEEGGGFAIANDLLTRNRVPYAAQCIGVAVAAQRLSIDYVRHRQTFGAPLATRQAVQWMIVDNEIDIRTSRWLTLQAAHKADKSQTFRFEAAMAKLVATEAAARVVDRAMQMHGGYGMSKDMPLERWWRELRIRRIGEGPSEIQRIIMARDLLM
ncbi:MAG: acyl-CoA dehydrogenase family protein [Dehalococcoidia bacterium]